MVLSVTSPGPQGFTDPAKLKGSQHDATPICTIKFSATPSGSEDSGVYRCTSAFPKGFLFVLFEKLTVGPWTSQALSKRP
jgi:hypothetical protein